MSSLYKYTDLLLPVDVLVCLQYGGWGPMGPNNQDMLMQFMPKEIITLKTCVLYPPPPSK